MKIMQGLWRALAVFFTLVITCLQVHAQSFDRKEFYSAMASGDTKTIDGQINLLKNWDSKDKAAFEGALLMKKAGLAIAAGKKLSLFKEGHKKLEAAIKKDSDNTEYRFLRLMIQEHAPGMLGYKDDLKKDSAYIRQSYKKLPAEVQQAITEYSKKSKVLKPGDF
ncbi:MAG: hypothetical protein JST09_18260 [Bacteroidetes bacterium]|nr:hypothetical protein [Bacteroidota bacterium]